MKLFTTMLLAVGASASTMTGYSGWQPNHGDPHVLIQPQTMDTHESGCWAAHGEPSCLTVAVHHGTGWIRGPEFTPGPMATAGLTPRCGICVIVVPGCGGGPEKPPTGTPEPGTWALMAGGLGLMVAGKYARR